MLRHLKVDPRIPGIINLPDDWSILLLAKTGVLQPFLYVAVIGPREFCYPGKLGEGAQVVFFTAESIRICPILNGQQQSTGGGFVDFSMRQLDCRITWTVSDGSGHAVILGHPTPTEDVLIAI